MTVETVARQRAYVNKQQTRGGGFGVVFPDAFLRGMRDLGYRTPAWALCEHVDNSIQSGADTISVHFDLNPPTRGPHTVKQIAICDDGCGMLPEMISYSVRWGGTDREDDRGGFGRYGYGLPSAAVYLAKRYTVYSKTANGAWHAVTVDIDALAAAASDPKRTEELLAAKPAELPKWLKGSSKGDLDLPKLASGMVIVLEDLDRLPDLSGWYGAKALQAKLHRYFGVIYRHMFPAKQILVNGEATQAVDPLFLMEHGRHFDANDLRAVKVETRKVELESRKEKGKKGTITIRAAVLPAGFGNSDPSKYGKEDWRSMNERYSYMKEFNGLLICRAGRQIDCVAPRHTRFQNNDRYIKIELDFDPELDEYFGLTTSKQQITIHNDVWEKLQHSGKGGGALKSLISDMRRAWEDTEAELKAEIGNEPEPEQPRPSATAMEAAEEFVGEDLTPTPEQKEEGDKNLEQEAARRARASGRPKEKERAELEAEVKKHRFAVEYDRIPEGPFYLAVRLGEQKRLVINTDHPFYSKVYEQNEEIQAALEVLLLVLADRELAASVNPRLKAFYASERQAWSQRLRHALDSLISDQSIIDKANSVSEHLHVTLDEGDADGE